MTIQPTLTAIRCDHCGARLLDTDGHTPAPGQASLMLQIKCWRCKTIVIIRLAAASASSILKP